MRNLFIDEYLNTLTYREREIVKLLYGLDGGFSFRYNEVARIFRVSYSTIRRKEKSAINKLSRLYEEQSLSTKLQNKVVSPQAVRDALEDISTLSIDLMVYMKNRPDDLMKLSSEVFEKLIAECLASRGFEEVRWVARDGRTSADIFAVEKSTSSDCRIRYFIEVKRWKQKVGVEVIDGVFGAIEGERSKWGWNMAMIVSLSGFKHCKKYTSENLEMRGLYLRDKNHIIDWLQSYCPSDKGLWLPSSFGITTMQE